MDRSFVSANSPYRQPVIPGAMTFSLAEGLTILSGILHKTGMAFLGVELEVLKPVHFGDTLRVVIEVIDLRTTKKPGRGIVTFRHDVKNQNESDVMVYTIKRMIRKR
jgi:acyl dehydratase